MAGNCAIRSMDSSLTRDLTTALGECAGPQEKTLQVGAFGKRARVIDGMGASLLLVQRAAGARRADADGLGQGVGVDPRGARGGDELAARRQEPRAQLGEPRVRVERAGRIVTACASAGGSRTTSANRRPASASLVISANASPFTVSCRQAATPGSLRFSAKFARASSSAMPLASSEVTAVAPPRAACSAKPPVYENASSTVLPSARRPTRARFSRWSRNQPVF